MGLINTFDLESQLADASRQHDMPDLNGGR